MAESAVGPCALHSVEKHADNVKNISVLILKLFLKCFTMQKYIVFLTFYAFFSIFFDNFAP